MSEFAEVDVERRGTVVVARVSGEIDVHNASAIGIALEAAVADGAHALVVDLTALEFVDSTAIHRLFSLAGRLRDHRQQLGVVVRAGGPIERALALVDFRRAAPVGTDLEAVIGRLEDPGT